MLNLLFWSLFVIGYVAFSVWLSKALLNGIFLAVSHGARAEKPVRSRSAPKI